MVVFHPPYVIVSTMTLDMPLPTALEQELKPQSAKLHFAVEAFAAEGVTLGQAPEIAGDFGTIEKLKNDCIH